jgi:hypothetical protein
MPDVPTDTLKLYLKALGPKQKIYFIGPYGRRISFAFQQRRAFNTVWALHEIKEIEEGTSVAVIGAGLCGVTVAAALLSKRCLVSIYDRFPGVLEFQSRATHRFVHPTINLWPEKEIFPTTCFPFFDWFESICSVNMVRLKQEWKDYFQRRVHEVLEANVTSIEYDTASNGVKVFAEGHGVPPMAEYEVAIVATGFGIEDSVVGATSLGYWEPDFLSERAEKADDIVVSGIGDGGLIDALRAVHKNFADGRLVIKLARQLTDSGVAARVERAEKQVAGNCGNDETVAAGLFAKVYEDLVKRSPAICTDILDGSYYRKTPAYRKQRVRLVGPLPFPYSVNSAPIHKYMIAHAISAGEIEYKQGRLAAGPVFNPTAGAPETILSDHCIVRHGVERPPLAKAILGAELNELKQTQMTIADLIENTPYPPSFWEGLGSYPRQDFNSLDFLRFRYKLAGLYTMEKYGRAMGIRFRDGERGYVITRPTGNSLDAPPTNLFGIPLILDDEEIAHEYAT